jgi:hypothetical protein
MLVAAGHEVLPARAVPLATELQAEFRAAVVTERLQR